MADRSVTGSPPVHTLDPERQLCRGPRGRSALGFLGTLSGRAAVGHRARGLLRHGDAWHLSRMTTPAPAPTAGARTASSASATIRQRLCFALALWNGHDPILKERLFGLTGPEGNHGEDVKEAYYYLDATPDPQLSEGTLQVSAPGVPLRGPRRREPPPRPGPARVRAARHRRLCRGPLLRRDVEYAKAAPVDILIRITATNRGPEPATLHLLPTLWFRNEWAWGPFGDRPRPSCAA